MTTMKISPSKGNVFLDIGFDEAEARDLTLRSKLMMNLKERIGALGKSQAEVANLLEVTQPRISNLVKGRIDLFSLDTLVTMLARLGAIVDVSVRAPSTSVAPSEGLVSLASSMSVFTTTVLGVQGTVVSTSTLTASTVTARVSVPLGQAISQINLGDCFFATTSPVVSEHVVADTQFALAA